jgi:hypothetical protein
MLLLFFIAIPVWLNSQVPLISVLDVDRGLPQNSVLSFYQEPGSVLWI